MNKQSNNTPKQCKIKIYLDVLIYNKLNTSSTKNNKFTHSTQMSKNT
jgi:hypothetical protein